MLAFKQSHAAFNGKLNGHLISSYSVDTCDFLLPFQILFCLDTCSDLLLGKNASKQKVNIAVFRVKRARG